MRFPHRKLAQVDGQQVDGSVHDGLDLLTVAQISGTSVRMIEKHYGHLRGDVAAQAQAGLAL
jgi:hypothetical protein